MDAYIDISNLLLNLQNYINEQLAPVFKKGGKIYIKPKNRGSFTKYCGGKVTQSCIDKAKKSNNPKIRKKAVFAENARKWNN